MNNIFKRINFRQPKYMLPAILYIPLLGTSYFFSYLFHTEKVEVQDKTLQTTEFLNPELAGTPKTQGWRRYRQQV